MGVIYHAHTSTTTYVQLSAEERRQATDALLTIDIEAMLRDQYIFVPQKWSKHPLCYRLMLPNRFHVKPSTLRTATASPHTMSVCLVN